MKITREFFPADRYVYDFRLCIYAKGWAQIVTAQDASYFGTWSILTRLMIFSYRKWLCWNRAPFASSTDILF